MKKTFLAVIPMVLFTSFGSQAQTNDQLEKITFVSKKISSLSALLGPDVNDVNLNWRDNPEVTIINSYSNLKKIASINFLVSLMQKNEDKMFPQRDTNQNQLATILISRIISYRYLEEFLSNVDDEVGVKDFLDGEISDLKLLINQKLTYQIYTASRTQRLDKITYLYMPNKYYCEELLKLTIDKPSISTKLANKTSAIALMQTCIDNLDLCEKI